jgi:predicted nucleotidyltransferase component of viral defense system
MFKKTCFSKIQNGSSSPFSIDVDFDCGDRDTKKHPNGCIKNDLFGQMSLK